MGKQNDKPQYDVIVVGTGYAGLAAALEALRVGASVIVLGRRNPFASCSALGGGAFAMVDTPMQREMGIRDSLQFFYEDIIRANRGTIARDVVTATAEEAVQLYSWLTNIGARFIKLMDFAGHSVLRVHLESGLAGANTLRLLLKAVESEGADVRLGTVAEHLLLDSNKEVKGVQAVSEGERTEIEASGAVVLAAGGFGKNPSLVGKHLPELTAIKCISGSGSTGDGINMGLEADAELLNMDSAVLCSLGSLRGKARVDGLVQTLAKGAILVNKQGQRFVDESLGYAKTSPYVMRQPDGVAFLIIDEGVMKDIEQVMVHMDKYLAVGAVLYAKTVHDLATAAGINTENLQDSAKGRFSTRGVYGAWVSPDLVFTYGGLKVNGDSQVIHRKGYPISHLYAAGDNAAGLCGGVTKECFSSYITGTGYTWALTSGRIAGRKAAAN
jgi:fumarate reductase flavoprotein subunit